MEIKNLEYFNTVPNPTTTNLTNEEISYDETMMKVLIGIVSALIFISIIYIFNKWEDIKTQQIIMILIFTIIYLNSLFAIIYKQKNHDYVKDKCNEIKDNDNLNINDFPLCENQDKIKSNFTNLYNMVISNCIVGFIAFLLTFYI